jgi:hypothetical protein
MSAARASFDPDGAAALASPSQRLKVVKLGKDLGFSAALEQRVDVVTSTVLRQQPRQRRAEVSRRDVCLSAEMNRAEGRADEHGHEQATSVDRHSPRRERHLLELSRSWRSE